MFLNWCKWTVSLLFLGAVLVLLSGCGQTNSPAPQTSPTAATGEGAAGWWCSEHGMPEEICAQCSTKLASEFQAKGDWCKEHNRPESQCLICHPNLKIERPPKKAVCRIASGLSAHSPTRTQGPSGSHRSGGRNAC